MSEYNRHKFAMEWMHGGGRDPNGRGLDEEIQIANDMWKEFNSKQAQLLPEEWDDLTPREELYYQQGPFSTHEDFRGAKGGTVPQLVQPGPGRPGYSGKKTKTPRQEEMTWLTKAQVKAMKKNLPDGISLVPDSHIDGQWNYQFTLEKDRGTKNYITKGKSLRATPENLEKLIEMREAAVKEMFPNRLTNREFKRLRFLPENISKTNEEFAKVINDLGYKTRGGGGKQGPGKFTAFTVKDQQIRIGIEDDVGKRGRLFPRKKSEVLKLIRESSGGKELLQIYNWDKHEKILRNRANAIVTQDTIAKSKGRFPSGSTNEHKLWESFFRATDQGDRIKIVGEFADGNLPRDADGYVDWYKKNKKGVPAWKRIEFVDTEAPKGKQRFKWEGLKGQVDNAFGSGFFARNTKGYDLAVLDSQRMFKGEKIGTLVRDKMLMKRLKNKIFESEGVRRQPTKLEVDEFMKRNKPSFTMTQGHHVEGVGKNPYKVEPAFQVANQKLEALRKDYAKGRIDKATFIKKMNELPGGIRYKVDDVLEGVKSTEPERVKAAVKAAGFNKNTANQIFKAYQAQGIGTKCQWKGKAEGGRIGFAEAGIVDDKCMRNAIQEHNNKLQSDDLAVRNDARAKQFKINKTKGLKNILGVGRRGLQGVAGFVGGWGGAAIEAAVEGAFYEHARRQGYNHKQAMAETFLPKVFDKNRETGIWEGAENLLADELVGKRDKEGYLKSATPHQETWFNVPAAEYQDNLKALENIQGTIGNIQTELNAMKANPGYTTPEQILAKEQELEAALIEGESIANTLKVGTPEQEAYIRAEEKQKALQDKRAQEHWGDTRAYKKGKERQWQEEFLDYRGADRKYRKEQPFAFKDQAIESSIVDLGSNERINWDAYKNYGWDKPEQKWKDLYDMGGWDLMDRIGIAGGVSKMSQGGRASYLDGGIVSLLKK